jgi:predicted MFS family arabinose efflux permease
LSAKWRILALLFFARCAMAAQFESVGAISPLLKAQGLTFSQLGILIGTYLAPGVVFALPGGVIIQRFGEKKTLLVCLALMTVGGVLALNSDWNTQLVARLISGSGGVILTVAATKMIVDLFSGRELVAAMGVFVVSWPMGIAIALVSLPQMGEMFGLYSAELLGLAYTVGAFLAIATALPSTYLPSQTWRLMPSSWQSIVAVSIAGAIWGIANAAFATLFSFGPTMLTAKGYSASAAASLVSVVLWVTILAIPVGGVIGARYVKTNSIIVACIVLAAALTTLAIRVDSALAVFVCIGIVSGLPGAAVMSLPSRVLDVHSRAVGMGIFYSIYYGIMLFVPILQGLVARQSQSAAATFDVAAILLLSAIPLLGVFNLLTRSINPSSELPVTQQGVS